MKKFESAIPNPKNLIHALRDIGYSIETAIADIIDNSITAESSEVRLIIHYELHNSYIIILDNGVGMSEGRLRDAMHLGSFDPFLKRDSKDLGRFGLGLKTASFSQASRLTVVSAHDNILSGRCWDFKHISSVETWEIEVLDEDSIKSLPEVTNIGSNGTIVLWDDLYRLIDTKSRRDPEDIFWEHIDDVREHLGLVFHRYLTGENGIKKLIIKINDTVIEPFNPFEGAGKPFPEENFNNIKMQAYLLPHHSKTSPEKYRYLAGRDGYLKSQGFYVYRNARLLISGTWFRLTRQNEATKLARVKIDLPSTEDFHWAIDVRKSQAIPPETIRIQLRRTIDKITSQSRHVYTKRGKKISRIGNVSIWQESHQHGQKSYRINTENPLIQSFLNSIESSQKHLAIEVFELIENGLPIDTIYADMLQEPENIKQQDIDVEVLEKAAESYWDMMQQAGLSEELIAERLIQNEPFSKYMGFCEIFIQQKKDDTHG